MNVKCPKCDNVAILDDDMKYVKCDCGYNSMYDEYIEEMKRRILSFVDELSYQ